MMDPPRHDQVRAAVSSAFGLRRVEALRPGVQRLVDELLGDVADRPVVDLVADIAARLPLLVLCELLGIPRADRDLIDHWAAAFVPMLEPYLSAEAVDRAEEANAALADYLEPLLAERRREPRDDVLSILARAGEPNDPLRVEDVVPMCVVILAAGRETTTDAVGNSMLALLEHPDQLDLLASMDDPVSVRGAIEELLRFDSPIQFAGRIVVEDVEIRGQPILRGEEVGAVIGAANRDPEVFDEPDRLDLRRGESRHLAFGAGPHFCLGAPLARMETQVAVDSIVRRWPRMELAGEPVRRNTTIVRGLSSLPVRVG